MASITRSIRALVIVVLVACCGLVGNVVGVWAQDAGSDTEQKLINPNTAGVEMLSKLPGLNEVIAKEIVILREQLGDFQSLEDLLEVKGMTKDLLEKITPYISLDPLKTDCSC